MLTRRLTITGVHRDNPISNVSPSDFTYEVGGEIDPKAVALDPKFSLYCFDPVNDSAIFVESSDPEAVDRAPFYYQGQIEHAIGLVSMPMEVFHRVANQISLPPKGIIFVHSVGRCGSTLISKVLGAVPGVHSLSEPDDITQLVTLRNRGDLSDDWIRNSLSSSIRWRCKPRIGKFADQVAIKSRSEVLVLADLLGSSFGQDKHFFLYRNALAWMRTIFRSFKGERDIYDQELNKKMEDSWARMLPLVRDLRTEGAPMNPIQVRILGWATCMEAYLQLNELDIPLCAARFEDLTADPVPILTQFFEFCEIDNVDWTAIHEVLGRDSQAGTVYDREERKKSTRELTPELIQDVYEMVASRPSLGVPDVILPLTLRPIPPETTKIGFMAGEIDVPVDFDRMGSQQIESMFGVRD